MLQAESQVVRRQYMSYVCRGVCTHYAHAVGKDDEAWHQRDKSEKFRRNEIVGRVHTHDVESIYLLRHAHGTEFGGDVTAHLAGKDKTHYTARKLKQHNLTRGVAAYPARHPRRLYVELHLYAYHRTDEERYQQHDAYGVNAKLRHLLYILFHEHTPAVWYGNGTPHQHKVFAKRL